VATHFATALVLFVVYWDDWVHIVSGLLGSIWAREFRPTNPDAKLGLLLIIGTVPGGAAGLVFQKQAQKLFISPSAAALFLMLNGALLYLAERLRRTAKPNEDLEGIDRRIAARMSWWQAAKVGIAQVLALLPGFSRTGSTIAGGLLIGFSHEEALRFSFLLATPIIGAAALLKLPVLFRSGGGVAIENAFSAVCAAAAASVSIKILTRYFQTKTLTPFAIYCAAVGLLSLIALGSLPHNCRDRIAR
jgi:undecaprenyl-diphosphatase